MSPIISTKHEPNIFYCPLAKAGSTFFTRYIMLLDRPGQLRSPFDIKIQDASRSNLESFNSVRGEKEKLDFLGKAYKFIFSRNPYSRIFSAYIDKLYSPNPYYWHELGLKAVALNGLHLSKHKCGTGVSFSDFVKTVLKDLHKKDLHFIPMTSMCKVCEIHWDMVGWVENSLTDIDYLSSNIKFNSSFQHSATYKMATAMDVIRDSTIDPLKSWTREINDCIGSYNMGRIMWRKFQIRGIIYNDIPFPFSEKDMEKVSLVEFQSACKQAAVQSVDKLRLKKQKEMAFKAAFRQVEQADLEAIQEIYKEDFYVFGYDPQPSSIFDEDGDVSNKIFDWTEKWVL